MRFTGGPGVFSAVRLSPVRPLSDESRKEDCPGLFARVTFPKPDITLILNPVSSGRKRHTAPPVTTFHGIPGDLPPGTLDPGRGHRPLDRPSGAGAPSAMDARDIRGASGQTGDGRQMMVAAGGHGTRPDNAPQQFPQNFS